MTQMRESTGLWLALVLPSSFIVHKFLSWEGGVAYAALVALTLRLRPRLPASLSNRTLAGLAVATLFVIVVVFLIAYPIANTHLAGWHGQRR
jgi:hypothetical protein